MKMERLMGRLRQRKGGVVGSQNSDSREKERKLALQHRKKPNLIGMYIVSRKTPSQTGT